MAYRDKAGHTIETPLEAKQAESSPNSFIILIISMVAAVIVGAGLLWHFGMFN